MPKIRMEDGLRSEPSSYIDNVYAIKIPKGTTIYTGPSRTARWSICGEDVMLCKPI